MSRSIEAAIKIGLKLRFLFIAGLLPVIFLDIVTEPALAQNINEAVRKCHESDEARYQCYLERYTDLLDRTREQVEKRRSILKAQADKRLELKPSPTLELDREKEDIRKLAEASRKRNVSHRGKAYSLTYGFVLEPRE